ncbi:hypothetical protein BpHYR1_029752 [Brachionus plicatilis]|uniref:Uncharacterized protein n=1 Tax=Brachionus plicatilis TaxID=10195 RepID=A0A3M7PFM8_BRAPC|nr:hypothetical protein BpHYR1_029752 [Brachionus plicatilis]
MLRLFISINSINVKLIDYLYSIKAFNNVFDTNFLISILTIAGVGHLCKINQINRVSKKADFTFISWPLNNTKIKLFFH